MKIKKCPICGHISNFEYLKSKDSRDKKNTQTFTYRKCRKCSVLFLASEKISNNFYNKYYGRAYYLKKSRIKNLFENAYSLLVNYQKLRIINKYEKDSNAKLRVLDVGSGDFGFVRFLKNFKFDITAIELFKEKVNLDDVNVINANFLNYRFGKEKFDLVTSWHVIEHVKNPRVFLAKIKKLLKPRGVAIISTPNINSLGFKISKNNWYHLDAPRHIVLFNNTNLKLLTKWVGFKTLSLKFINYEFPFDLVHSLKSVNIIKKLVIVLLYPLFKIVDNETVTIVIKND